MNRNLTFQDPHGQQVVEPKVCQNCGADRPLRDFAEGGTMAWVHGVYARWCEVCILTRMLEFARERAAAIPELEKKLAAAKAVVE